MEQQFVIKGPLAPLVALAIVAAFVWFDLHDPEHADLVARYSGTVVEEGSGYHIFRKSHSHYYYIVVQDSTGKRQKRYVDYNGYLAVKVGEYVVKQPGLGEIPQGAGRK